MQMIHDALLPEVLAKLKPLLDHEADVSETERAAQLDMRLRAKADADAEADDRNRHERRKAAAMERART